MVTHNGTPIEVEEEDEEGDPQRTSASVASNKRKKPMTEFFQPRTTLGSQKSIKSALATKEMVDAADMEVSRFWFDANLPFNAIRSKFCQPMVDAIFAIGTGYKMPSYHDLRGKVLTKNVTEVNDFVGHFKESWSATGCSIMEDG